MKKQQFYSSPHRLKKLLNELREFIGGERKIQVSRELTKKFEEHVGENVNQVIDYFRDKEVLGEITIVIKGRDTMNENIKVCKLELKKNSLN